MIIDVERMREAFQVAAAWCGWSDADQAEIGAAIAKAIKAQDETLIAWWANYLDQASGLTRLGQLCRAAEARIRADAEKEKAAA
jgi:hypothetical protein